MKKKLIVNADDFGFGKKITDAIIDCHSKGIVTSTTIMTNMPAAEYAVQRAKQFPELGVGVHLVLTQGKPVSRPEDVPDLIGDDGDFLSHKEQAKQLWVNKNIFKQVCHEFEAQVTRAFELGLSPTHCDSHHGIFRMPIAINAMSLAAKKLKDPKARNPIGYSWTGPNSSFAEKIFRIRRNLPLAVKIMGHTYNKWVMRTNGISYTNYKTIPKMLVGAPSDSKLSLIATLENLPYGVSEIVCHPGYPDIDVIDSKKTAQIRIEDTLNFMDVDVIQEIKRNNIELINFSGF